MKQKFLGLLFITAIAVVSCAQTKKATSGRTSDKSPVAPSGIQYSSVKMYRTACYGKCPSYELTLNRNGIVQYNGKRFTQYSGLYEKNIGAAKAEDLLTQFQSYRADTCQDQYPMRVADLPGLILYIQYADKTKEIRNANFGPAFLKEMAKKMDAVGTVDNTWKKVTAESKD